MQTLWMVGRFVRKYSETEVSWEFHGIYDEKDKAISACRTSDYFVGPVILNQALGTEREKWPDCFYPIQPEEEVTADA